MIVKGVRPKKRKIKDLSNFIRDSTRYPPKSGSSSHIKIPKWKMPTTCSIPFKIKPNKLLPLKIYSKSWKNFSRKSIFLNFPQLVKSKNSAPKKLALNWLLPWSKDKWSTKIKTKSFKKELTNSWHKKRTNKIFSPKFLTLHSLTHPRINIRLNSKHKLPQRHKLRIHWMISKAIKKSV